MNYHNYDLTISSYSKRGKICWCIYFTPKEGKRVQKWAPQIYQTESEVREWAKQFIFAYENNLLDQVEKQDQAKELAGNRNLTIKDLYVKWCNKKKESVSEKHGNQLEQVFRDFILTCEISTIPIIDLRVKHGLLFMEHLKRIKTKRGRPLSAWTVKNVASHLRLMISDVVAFEWAGDVTANFMVNPNVTKALPKIDMDELDIAVVPLDSILTLLQTEHPNIPIIRRIIYIITTTTGCRSGEIHGFRWRDFTCEKSEMNRFKGQKFYFLHVVKNMDSSGHLGDPKKQGFRKIVLHPLAVQALLYWRKKWVEQFGREPEELDPIFANNQCRHYKPDAAALLRNDLSLLGLPTHSKNMKGNEVPIVFHALRKTCTTLLADEDVDDDPIADILGHRINTVTRKHYMQRRPERHYSQLLKLPFPLELAWLRLEGK